MTGARLASPWVLWPLACLGLRGSRAVIPVLAQAGSKIFGSTTQRVCACQTEAPGRLAGPYRPAAIVQSRDSIRMSTVPRSPRSEAPVWRCLLRTGGGACACGAVSSLPVAAVRASAASRTDRHHSMSLLLRHCPMTSAEMHIFSTLVSVSVESDPGHGNLISPNSRAMRASPVRAMTRDNPNRRLEYPEIPHSRIAIVQSPKCQHHDARSSAWYA